MARLWLGNIPRASPTHNRWWTTKSRRRASRERCNWGGPARSASCSNGWEGRKSAKRCCRRFRSRSLCSMCCTPEESWSLSGLSRERAKILDTLLTAERKPINRRGHRGTQGKTSLQESFAFEDRGEQQTRSGQHHPSAGVPRICRRTNWKSCSRRRRSGAMKG